LGPGETDIGQRAIIQGGEVPTRTPALTPNDDGRDEGRPRANRRARRGGVKKRKVFWVKGWVLRDIGFFL
jgi:hypothetical protein